jgi:molecular chaperone GrpE
VRKRSSKQLVDGRRFAQAEVLRSFLDVNDNFERALQSMGGEADTEATKSLREGIDLVFQNFRRVLKDQGVEPIEALEAEFDPAFHEAVGQFEREGVEPGHVIEVVQQGFKLGDMVLRPSRVIISA